MSDVDKSTRIGQTQFVCKSWGFEKHADLNAALNILASGQFNISLWRV